MVDLRRCPLSSACRPAVGPARSHAADLPGCGDHVAPGAQQLPRGRWDGGTHALPPCSEFLPWQGYGVLRHVRHRIEELRPQLRGLHLSLARSNEAARVLRGLAQLPFLRGSQHGEVARCIAAWLTPLGLAASVPTSACSCCFCCCFPCDRSLPQAQFLVELVGDPIPLRAPPLELRPCDRCHLARPPVPLPDDLTPAALLELWGEARALWCTLVAALLCRFVLFQVRMQRAAYFGLVTQLLQMTAAVQEAENREGSLLWELGCI